MKTLDQFIPEVDKKTDSLCSISDLTEIILGGTPSTSVEEYWNGDIQWASAKDISSNEGRFVFSTEKTITDLGVQSSSAKICPKGTIVITSRGTVGKLAILPFAMSFNQTCYGLIAKKEVDYMYIYYALIYSLRNIESLTYGTVFDTITIKTFDELFIPYPDKTSRRIITSILDNIDSKIELNNLINQTLETLAQSLFHSWFVRFDPFQDGEFVDTELGLIPKGWSIKKINEICTTQYGYTQSASEEEIGPRFLRITDIQGSKIDWNEVPFCEISDESFQKYKLHSGDILIARTGASTGENVYIENCPISVFASYLIRLKLNNTNLARYVGVFLRSYSYKQYIEKILSGSAQPNANAKTLTNISILVPTEEVINRFGNLIQTLEEKKYENSVENIILSSLHDLLLPQLLSRKLRIKNPEQFLKEIESIT